MRLQFIRYGLAGGAALSVHLTLLAVLVDGLGQDETISSAIGFISAVPVNYYLQRQYVFRSSAGIKRSFALYCVLTVSMLGINTGAFWLLVNQTNVHYVAAQIITTSAVVMLNYIASSTLTFSERTQW